jgi:D-amino-acid dehydrogenase
MPEVAIIGGGIVGSAAAYALARNGVTVALIDGTDTGQATAAGAGIISPGTGFRPGFLDLAAEAVRYYPEMLGQLAEDGETQTGYAVSGCLYVAMNAEEAALIPQVQGEVEARRERGVPGIGEVRRVDAQEARALFPPLAEIAAGVHLSGVARINGRLLRDALQRGAIKRGATIVHARAELVRQSDRVTAVRAEADTLPVEGVIIAGGAWSGEMGIEVPVYPQRGQILHLDLPDVETGRWPVVLGFHSHYILAFPEHRVVAGATREDGSGYDVRVTASGAHEVTGEALRVAPGLAGGTLVEVRVGLRPATPDGLPILGRAPGLDNVYLATGHGPSGLTLGPHSGKLIADLLQGKQPAVNLAPYTLDRFVKRPTG